MVEMGLWFYDDENIAPPAVRFLSTRSDSPLSNVVLNIIIVIIQITRLDASLTC